MPIWDRAALIIHSNIKLNFCSRQIRGIFKLSPSLFRQDHLFTPHNEINYASLTQCLSFPYIDQYFLKTNSGFLFYKQIIDREFPQYIRDQNPSIFNEEPSPAKIEAAFKFSHTPEVRTALLNYLSILHQARMNQAASDAVNYLDKHDALYYQAQRIQNWLQSIGFYNRTDEIKRNKEDKKLLQGRPSLRSPIPWMDAPKSFSDFDFIDPSKRAFLLKNGITPKQISALNEWVAPDSTLSREAQIYEHLPPERKTHLINLQNFIENASKLIGAEFLRSPEPIIMRAQFSELLPTSIKHALLEAPPPPPPSVLTPSDRVVIPFPKNLKYHFPTPSSWTGIPIDTRKGIVQLGRSFENILQTNVVLRLRTQNNMPAIYIGDLYIREGENEILLAGQTDLGVKNMHYTLREAVADPSDPQVYVVDPKVVVIIDLEMLSSAF